MTLEAERELWDMSQNGDHEALQELIEANLGDLWPIARALAKEGGKWTPDDLFQEGALALVKFAERWEPQAGVPFGVAARMRVRGAMKDFLRRKSGTVRGQTEAPLSLDRAETPGGRTLGERLSDEHDEGEELALDLSTLPPLQREIIAARILRPTPEPLAEVAARCGVTPERVARVQRWALKNLRRQAA